jgi:hypothetical protein
MPVIIHTSAGFANNKLVLSAQNYTEDDRGLVSASLQYVAKASNRSAVDAMFYTDAPPPIWPTYLDRGRLIARNLFMQSRSITEQYGLLTIDALFVGGREQIIPTVASDFESPVSYFAQSAPYDLSAYDPVLGQVRTVFGNLISYLSYTYTPIVTSLSFVRVGGIDSYTPQKPQTESMYTLVSFDNQGWQVNGLQLVSIKSPRQFFTDRINGIPVIEDRKTESLTPTVQIITVRYSMQ